MPVVVPVQAAAHLRLLLTASACDSLPDVQAAGLQGPTNHLDHHHHQQHPLQEEVESLRDTFAFVRIRDGRAHGTCLLSEHMQG